MWISRQLKPVVPTADADLGVTTIQGGNVGVMTRGEVRALPVYGPGGYIWLPQNGAAVLVVKGGPGGEEQCVTGMKQRETPRGMKPGEVFLYGPGENSVYLKQDGSVEVKGTTVSIEGQLIINGQFYVPCTCGEGEL